MAEQLKISAAEYHADPVDPISLSSSIAKTIVSQSAAHAYCAHPKLGGEITVPTDPMIEGSVLHALLLNQPDDIAVLDFDSYRTKEAKALRDATFEENRTPVLKHKYDGLVTAAEKIAYNFGLLGVDISGGTREMTVVWDERTDWGDSIKCRTRIDFYDAPLHQVLELKKISSAVMRNIVSNCYERGYDIQYAAHCAALSALSPELSHKLDYIFVFFEVDPPYAVVPVRPTGAFEELGMRRWNRAGNIWGRCLSKNQWPSLANSIGTLEPPHWAITDQIEAEELAARHREQSVDFVQENVSRLYK